MGYKSDTLPKWSDIRILTAQLAKRPLFDSDTVDTSVVIGPRAKKPLRLQVPIFVSDMSFGSLSARAKISLSKGAEMAGTGICSGEGGSLDEERRANTRYFYELASAKFGWDIELMADGNIGAFHFKSGQGAKTGAGGHLPGAKVTDEIARVRKLPKGQDAISPPTFRDLVTPTTRRSQTRSAPRAAASRSGSRSARSTSARTSCLRSRPARTTSSSTGAAAGRAPRVGDGAWLLFVWYIYRAEVIRPRSRGCIGPICCCSLTRWLIGLL
jgi:hypothetical protein